MADKKGSETLSYIIRIMQTPELITPGFLLTHLEINISERD